MIPVCILIISLQPCIFRNVYNHIKNIVVCCWTIYTLNEFGERLLCFVFAWLADEHCCSAEDCRKAVKLPEVPPPLVAEVLA
jgi:hypothetical protein